MFSKENLTAYGADYEKGLKLCVGKEDFYFRMIKKGLANEKFASLGENLKAGDLKKAFDDAHALKGVAGNLALTPLFNAVCDIVEPLRLEKADADYDALYAKIIASRDALAALQ